jgi:hypothetical protein
MSHLPTPPSVFDLTRAQVDGHACCFCSTDIWHGAVSAGRAPGRSGAHDLSIEVYACQDCARPPKADQQGDDQ